MSAPLVSIVIPLYNKAEWIIPTLQSIVNQSYTNWECIIIDDGSTDNSYNLVTDFFAINEGMWKIVKQVNQGQAVARNLGISHSNGKYIALLDADDLWFARKLEKQVHFLERNSSVSLLYCSYVVFEDTLRKNMRVIKFGDSKKMVRNWFQMLGFGGLIESVSLIRASLFQEIGFFDSSLSTSSGLDIALRAMLVTDTAILGDVLVAYRISENQWHKDSDELALNCRRLDEKYGDIIGTKNRVSNFQNAYLDYNSKRKQGIRGVLVVLKNHLKAGNLYGVRMFFALASRNFASRALTSFRAHKLIREITAAQSTNRID